MNVIGSIRVVLGLLVGRKLEREDEMARLHIDSPSHEDISQIVAAIDGLASIEEAEDRLEELLTAYFTHPEAAQHLRVWFRLYERFPEDDNHYFWSVLHGLEHHAACPALVVESVRRRPSGVPVRLVNRMLNAGSTHIGDVDLLELLRAVARDENALPSIREDAEDFLEYQRSRHSGTGR
jgi:hypothetical protein